MLQRSYRQALLATVTAVAVSLPVIAQAEDADLDALSLKLRPTDLALDKRADADELGGEADIAVTTMPELGLSYLFTPTDSIELVLAPTPFGTQGEASILDGHDFGDAGLGNGGFGDAGFGDLQPPSLVLQYHVDLSSGWKPYGGIGFNNGIAYSDDAGGALTALDSGWGWALQAGVDYLLADRWALNVDVKKIFVSPDAERTDGVQPSEIDVDPWVVGAGLAFRY